MKKPSFALSIALIINLVVIIVSYIGFRLAISWSNPLIFSISSYSMAFFVPVFIFGILYVLFNEWPEGQKALAVVFFICIMIVLWMIASWWIQPNSDYLGNAGTGVIGAVIGGFICKVLIPD